MSLIREYLAKSDFNHPPDSLPVQIHVGFWIKSNQLLSPMDEAASRVLIE
jgi:hypothetical protein